jgi:hypothetical protein
LCIGALIGGSRACSCIYAQCVIAKDFFGS